MKLPNFIHAGVPKSASGTLGTVLRSHPQIFLPRQKEPNFFSSDEKFQKGLAWYSDVYFSTATTEAVLGDLSIGYSTGFGLDVPERIAEHLGRNVKILLTFRDPVWRAYSQYAMAHYKGQLDQLSFAESVNRGLAIGSEVSNADRLRVRTGTYYSNKRDMDIYRWCLYIEPGYYADIYRRWVEIFGANNVMVLITEELAGDLQQQADRLFSFLGVESMPVKPDLRRNEATALRYPWIKRILNRVYAVGAIRQLLNQPGALRSRKWLRRRFLSGNYVPNTKRPPPDKATVLRLQAHYQPQVDALEGLLGRPIPYWLERGHGQAPTG